MQLAPIVLFTFNRLEHTKKTIEYLRKNALANESDLYIFSDGPRNSNEAKKVEKVREFLESVDGFKSVNIIKEESNKGLAKSVIGGVTDIISRYKKVIVLEDDLVTSPNFIAYMNDALDLYKERKDIWSIAGYSPNINIPNQYDKEVYLVGRASSWGWATWEDRWILNDWDIKDYNSFKNNRQEKKSFNTRGTDMAPMLEDQMKGRIDSWAVRWVYNQFKNNMLSVYPTKSLVRNVGNDLSGTHTAITDKYEVELYNGTIKLDKDIQVSKEISLSFKGMYDLSFTGYIAIIIKKLGLYRPARKLRNKMMIIASKH